MSQLKSLNADLAQSSVAFNSCSFHSDQYIAIRNVDARDASSQLIVVNPTTKQAVIAHPTLAESIIMHPRLCIAALRSTYSIHVLYMSNVVVCV
mgnify:CR=1